MVKIGNFFFRYRNILFPCVFVLLFFEGTWPVCDSKLVEMWEIVIGIIIALSGQILRALTIGLAYIKRGGKKKAGICGKTRSKWDFCTLQKPPLFRKSFDSHRSWNCRKLAAVCFVWDSVLRICLFGDHTC